MASWAGRQGLQEKFCRAEQECFGARGQTETSLKSEDFNCGSRGWSHGAPDHPLSLCTAN